MGYAYFILASYITFDLTHCTVISPKEGSNMQTGGVVAAAVTIPLVLILLGAMIGYGVYICKNPEGFGRSTTYKQFCKYDERH